jgi:hypothetical protein
MNPSLTELGQKSGRPGRGKNGIRKTYGYTTPATPNALCFHVWICSQVWLNLPSENFPLFPHLPTDDGHFGYKQKQVRHVNSGHTYTRL